MGNQFWLALIILGAIILLALILFGFTLWFKSKATIHNPTFEGAKGALEGLADWAKWLSGIQTAALGGLAIIIKDRVGIEQEPAVMITAFLMGGALICSAWVLSSIPSLTLRIYAEKEANEKSGIKTSDSYEIYNLPLYHAFPRIPVSFMLTLQHWLWGLGILAFAYLLVQ